MPLAYCTQTNLSEINQFADLARYFGVYFKLLLHRCVSLLTTAFGTATAIQERAFYLAYIKKFLFD